jgi:hypothetical protein
MKPMGSAARTATAAVLLGATACSTSTDLPSAIVQMTPAEANSDLPVPAIIYGASFRPAYRFDAISGEASIDTGGFSALLSPSAGSAAKVKVPLSSVVWESTGMLQALVPKGVAPGSYDLVVGDPRGFSSRLQSAFFSLGHDLTPPVVTISAPTDDSIVGAQAKPSVVVQAGDGYGQVVSLLVTVRTDGGMVLSHDCAAAVAARAACTFSFVAPTPASDPAALYIDATATDAGGNTGTAETVLELVPAPGVTSLSPSSGSTTGQTIVTVAGSSFLAGATQVLFDGVAALVTVQSSTTISVVAPQHPAGMAAVTVEIGGASTTVSGGFVYVAPPLVRVVSPAFGPMAGGTAVSVLGDNFQATTQIFFGGLPLACPNVVSPNRIDGFSPPGVGLESVAGYDPILTVLTDGPGTFTYLTDGGLSGGDGGIAPLAYPADGGCLGGAP